MTGRLITTCEVAERLGVCAETVLRWVRRGELPAIRLPSGALRFPETMLDEWLAAHATPGRRVSPTTPGVADRTLHSIVSPTTENGE